MVVVFSITAGRLSPSLLDYVYRRKAHISLNTFPILSTLCFDCVCACISWLIASVLPSQASRNTFPPSIELVEVLGAVLHLRVRWTSESPGEDRGQVGLHARGKSICSQAEPWTASTKTSQVDCFGSSYMFLCTKSFLSVVRATIQGVRLEVSQSLLW